MKTKRVNRYYCDYCKKSGCSAGHMKKHEERCTNNPNRKCGMCKTAGNKQASLSELIALLPKEKDFMTQTEAIPEFGFKGETFLDYGKFADAINSVMPKLRELTGDCPACILAALRQSKITAIGGAFDFKEECERFWRDIHDGEFERERHCL